jgi:hypothetical protein
MTLSELLASTSRVDLVHLIEIEPGKRIDTESWAQDPGDSPAFYFEIPREDFHNEGAPTSVSECLQDDAGAKTDYEEAVYLATCKATAESFFFDAAQRRLYVHTSDSDDPSTVDKYFLMSTFLDAYCNKQFPSPNEIVFGGRWYEPILNESSIQSINERVSAFEGAAGYESTWGAIKLLNANGYFDQRLYKYINEAKSVTYRIGARGWVYGDYLVLWTGWTGSTTWTEDFLTIEIEGLEKHVP